MQSLFLLLGSAALTLALAACGSDVEKSSGAGGSGGTSDVSTTGAGLATGNPCEQSCEAWKVCPDYPPTDCPKLCAEMAQMAADIGCSSQYDDLASCSAALPPCTMQGCDAEANAYVSCQTAYCKMFPPDAGGCPI